jgi:hypothetical protein
MAKPMSSNSRPPNRFSTSSALLMLSANHQSIATARVLFANEPQMTNTDIERCGNRPNTNAHLP